MDRNTIIGLVLIGLTLSVFAIMNQPSEEELKKQKKELAAQEKKVENKKVEDKTEDVEKISVSDSTLVPKLNKEGNQQKDKNGGLIYTDKNGKDTVIIAVKPNSVVEKPAVKEEITSIENEKLILEFTNKGGQLASVRLKEFESYDDYAKKDKKLDPVTLFKNGDASNGLIIPVNGKKLYTASKDFELTEKSDSKVVYTYSGEENEKIQFIYTLNQDKYDFDFAIKISGYQGKVTPKNVMFKWDVAYRRTERLFSEQRRVSTVCFNYKNDGFSWLSEMGDGYEEAGDDIEWVNFKQSYFSSIIKPDNTFLKDGSSFKTKQYSEGNKKAYSNLKDFSAVMNLNLKDVENETIHMNWFFGPNDYKVLKSYDSGYDNILNYGWGLFRWINLYAVEPLFAVLNSSGMGIGLSILLLTLILKLVLMPIQWKMFVSSAKMRIMKPEIDEINKKYPNKEDAMKKQMEVMSLYRESGASPLSGCVPMLIQMPILLAVFRFFPATFGLRQESFLWAEDLSSYDSIYDFGFNIWIYGDHISLFTLLMSATTLIYTFLNSGNVQTPDQPGMPNMKVIMYIFPVMMIFFFNNYSSGLSYYYFISTLISILLMIAIKKFFVDEEKLRAKMAARKASNTTNPKVKKKSKFQERLEQMQKAQMDQMQKRKK